MDRLKKRPVSIGWVVLVIYLIPTVPFFFDTKFLIHDFLNSNVVWFSVLKKSGMLLQPSNANLDFFIGQIPRGCYPSELDVVNLIFQVFSLEWALFINHAVIHLVAFFGMHKLLLLLDSKFNRERSELSQWLILCISLAFSLLPFWTPGGLSIAGQPLIIFGLISLFYGERIILSFFILFLVSFYSSFIFSTFFLLIECGIAFLFISIYKRRISFWLFMGLVVLMMTSLLSEYRLFYMQFVEKLVSQRVPIDTEGSLNFMGLLGVSIVLFIKGQYHAHSNAFPILIILVIPLIMYQKRLKIVIFVMGIAILQFLLVMTLNLIDWMPFAKWIPNDNILNSLQLRFYTLLPLFWHVLLFILIINLRQKVLKRFQCAALASIIAICFLRIINVGVRDYQGSSYADNRFYTTLLSEGNTKYATLDNYYRTEQFEPIRAHLSKLADLNEIKVACIDISPQIAQMNGFKTLGGYYPYYPLENKFRFLEYVKDEYAQTNTLLLEQIQNWGSQCFFITSNSDEGQCRKARFDYTKMKADGAMFVIAENEICNEQLETVNVSFKSFQFEQSLFIYRIL